MKIIWLITGVVFAGLILGWWASRWVNVPAPQQPLSTSYQPSSDGSSSSDLIPSPLLSQTNSGRPNPRWNRKLLVAADSTTNWEDKIEEILDAEDQDDEKAKKMLVLFPDLPLDGQVEVAQHLGHMLPDENYPALVPYLTNSATAEPLLDTLLAGLLGRPDLIKLPLLLTIAEDEQHPKSEEALNYLEGFLGENLGTNWEQWSATVDQRLQAQPEPGETTPNPP